MTVTAPHPTPAPAPRDARPDFDCIAAFLRAAVPGSQWYCDNLRFPQASGPRTVTGGKRVLRYTGTRADGTPLGAGRREAPTTSTVRLDGHRIHFLDDADPTRVAFTWTWISGPPAATSSS